MVLKLQQARRSLHQITHSHLLADDSSTSSTLTVDPAPQDKPQEPTGLKRPKRSVHFHLGLNTAYDNKMMCKEELKVLWYRGADLKLFKQATFALSRHISQAEEKNNAPFSYKRIFERAYEVCCKAHMEEHAEDLLSSTERRHLQRWTDIAGSRIGVEKWAIKPLGRDRMVRRSELVDIVLELQLVDTECADSKAEFIRQTCERISRPSRLFARITAHALAVVSFKETFYAIEC